MGFKPNFEINFRPSASSFVGDNQQGLTHTAAGLSTEFIILGEDSEGIEAKINPYGDNDFLEGEGRIRDKVRKDIQNGVKNLFGSPLSNYCEYNENKAEEIRRFKSNPPDEIGGRKLNSNARRSIATQEAQVQLEIFEAAIARDCILPEGEDELTDAEAQVSAAEEALVSTGSKGSTGTGASMQASSGLGGNALIILGGAVLLGGILFFAIKR
jgi:hypothetical protein